MITVTIAILAYNEGKSISSIIGRLRETFVQNSSVRLKIVVVDNGSRDNTTEVLKQLTETDKDLSWITIPVNKGYGHGVKKGIQGLSGDIVGFMWGDNQFDASILQEMVELFRHDAQVQFVKTYREKRLDGRLRLVVSKIYQMVFNILFHTHIRDINSGPKLFRYNFAQQMIPYLTATDWFIDAEMMIYSTSHLTPEQYAELPIVFYPRKYGKSNVRFSACWQFFKNLLIRKFIRPI